MVSSLAFSTFKSGLPSVISKVHSELIFKECMLQSLLTQVDLTDPDIFFQGQSWGLIVTCIGDWGFLIWIGILYSCWGKILAKFLSIIIYVSNSYRFETKFILWLRTVWKCLSQKHWDLIRNWGDHSVQYSHLVLLIPLIEIRIEWYIWALQSSKLSWTVFEYFFWNLSSFWCFKELFLARNLFPPIREIMSSF